MVKSPAHGDTATEARNQTGPCHERGLSGLSSAIGCSHPAEAPETDDTRGAKVSLAMSTNSNEEIAR